MATTQTATTAARIGLEERRSVAIPNRQESTLPEEVAHPGGGRSPRIFGVGGQMFSSLKQYPNFRRLWISNLFFFGGVWTQTLVLGWIVFDMTGSEFLMAVFTAVRLAPMLLGPLSGAISDRFDRIKLLLAASAWALVTITVVAALASTNHISYWGLVIGGLCIGMTQSPSQPARSTLVLDFVGRGSLSNANALNSIAMNMTQVIGPAIGGGMIAAFGAPVALWISAAWHLISLMALWPLRKTGKAATRAAGESLAKMLALGVKAVFSNRLATSVLLITLIANILLWPIYQAFMPVFAHVGLGLDADGLGWLLTCSGLGGLLGSLSIAALGDFKFKGALFVIGTGAWGALWAAFALSSSVPLSFTLMAAIGLASSPFGILQTTLLLMMTEPSVQGRVMGIQELAIGVMPLSALALGAAAELIGVAAVALISGVLLVLLLAVLTVRVPALLRYSGSTRKAQPRASV
ncbi:MFS transporter [Microtetraspora malaysiensis]|uniref:MFS transporter n=1 Tax=Microtetraspora malaysiensis TaxID=161358 RepID=UPI003D915A9A